MNPVLDRALTATAIIASYTGFALFALLALAVVIPAQIAALVATPFIRTPRPLPARERAGRRTPPQTAARLRSIAGARG